VTEAEKLEISSVSTEQLASHLALSSLNLRTLQSDDDVHLNGYAAKEISDRLRSQAKEMAALQDALIRACVDGWADGASAYRSYLREGRENVESGKAVTIDAE
jgi:hypothetical protein